VLAIYATYATGQALKWHSWFWSAVAVASCVACTGTALLKTWSPWLVYVLSAGFVLGWLQSIYLSLSAGYYSFMASSWIRAAVELAPGAVLAILSCIASWSVFRHIQRARRGPGPTLT
jgi:hypothetical protein